MHLYIYIALIDNEKYINCTLLYKTCKKAWDFFLSIEKPVAYFLLIILATISESTDILSGAMENIPLAQSMFISLRAINLICGLGKVNL